MKKALTKRRSTQEALPEMPEVDFSIYRIRRNPYAGRIAREGFQIAHWGPSDGSLVEMPEADFNRAYVRANKYARQAALAASKIQYGKGRPRRADEVGETPARTLRLPKAVWRALEIEAREHASTVHALVRELIVNHVTRRRAHAELVRKERPPSKRR